MAGRAKENLPGGSLKYLVVYFKIRIFKCSYRTFIFLLITDIDVIWPDFNDLISSKSKCIPISILFIDFIWAASKNYWTFPNKVDYWGFLVPAKNNIYRGVVDYKNARLQQTKDTLFCYIPLSLQYFQMIPPSVHVWSDIFIHFPPCCDIKLALGDAAPSWFWALRCIVLPSDGSRMLDNSLNSLRKTSCPSSGGPPKYLGQLLTGFTRRPPPSEVIVRKRQAEVRLKYLEDGNFPANKFEVLPGLREFVRDNHDWREQLGLVSEDLSDIESRSTNDTISVHSSEPEQEAEDTNPFGDSVLRAAWERLQAKGPEYIEQLRREGQGQPIPNLPERFRRGPRLEPSSSSAAASSSTVPAPKARPLIRLASWLFNARCLPGNVRACGVVHQSYRRYHTK